MAFQVSAGGVVFRRAGNAILFFLLGFKERGVWCLPKGLIEEGETELEAAEREVAEETGIADLKLVDKVGTIRYQFWYKRRRINKTVHFYLFETNQAETKIGEEHDAYGWFNFDGATKALTYENERKILEKAYEMIKKRERSLLEFMSGESEGESSAH
ncbi:TPA: NUDIX domain-containing protein [Candidatus Bathyarchaeota archaeon]|nr:NUDIX domain-containing protein [Candidatus Bathyarchaeota archaeon]